MIKDFQKALKDILLFLDEFDKAWKSTGMKDIFPEISKDRIENLENDVNALNKHDEIQQTFSNWETIGVWNASDFITFLLTSRLTFYLADRIENDDKEGVKQAIKYLHYFMNYLLLTNIHPPSETHGDYKPFYSTGQPFPATYADAQDKMRSVLAEHFAKTIWSNNKLKLEFVRLIGHRVSSINALQNFLKTDLLGKVTPPLLLKNVGLAKELFIFFKLISENIGFVIPTLLYQRIFKGLSSFLSGQMSGFLLVRTPDFIVIKGGRVMGVEVGREREFFRTAKGALITTFSGTCAIPTTQVNVLLGNQLIDGRYDLGIKCNRCYRNFTLCKAFISGEIGERPSFYKLPENSLTCKDICGEEESRQCLDAVADAKIMNYDTGRLNKKLVHYRCLLENEISEAKIVVPLYPVIEGIEILKEGLA